MRLLRMENYKSSTSYRLTIASFTRNDNLLVQNSEKPSQLILNVEGEDYYEAMELSPQRNVKREYDTDFRVD